MIDSKEDNRAVVLRLYTEGIDGGEYRRVARELVAEHAVMHGVPYGAGTGRELIEKIWGALHEAFRDLRFRVDALVAEGDEVAIRGATVGVHHAEFAGTPPTGREVEERAVVFYRLRDGLITDIWPLTDRAGLLAQFAPTL